ncbi:hypothetical protein K2Z83_28560 [Oscillochloris sp. ZM17-4]|uniref:hypothetical protein n=1 Tax=Oscillochloris sp. ZM17-4 TaxID=2866714 RepID=UPI001C735714|nr:hypothetical protein [Oscillochloris sp. ZM17-4]MBX0331609.1 hypothetical protein [Oscillochloris sp. ZM17-4]
MRFDIISEIDDVATIAANTSIREVERLRKIYGKARWRKKKGIAMIVLEDGTMHRAELHWYEATSFGRKEVKIKYLLD